MAKYVIENEIESDLMVFDIKIKAQLKENRLNELIVARLRERVIITTYLSESRLMESVDFFAHIFNQTELIPVFPALQDVHDVYVEMYGLDTRNFVYSLQFQYNYLASLRSYFLRHKVHFTMNAFALFLIIFFFQLRTIHKKRRLNYTLFNAFCDYSLIVIPLHFGMIVIQCYFEQKLRIFGMLQFDYPNTETNFSQFGILFIWILSIAALLPFFIVMFVMKSVSFLITITYKKLLSKKFTKILRWIKERKCCLRIINSKKKMKNYFLIIFYGICILGQSYFFLLIFLGFSLVLKHYDFSKKAALDVPSQIKNNLRNEEECFPFMSTQNEENGKESEIEMQEVESTTTVSSLNDSEVILNVDRSTTIDSQLTNEKKEELIDSFYLMLIIYSGLLSLLKITQEVKIWRTNIWCEYDSELEQYLPFFLLSFSTIHYKHKLLLAVYYQIRYCIILSALYVELSTFQMVYRAKFAITILFYLFLLALAFNFILQYKKKNKNQKLRQTEFSMFEI